MRKILDPSWKICSNVPGRIRLRHPAIGYYPNVDQAIGRYLINMCGILEHKINQLGSSVLIFYDVRAINSTEIIEELQEVLKEAFACRSLEGREVGKEISLASLGILVALVAKVFTGLVPVSRIVTIIASLPLLRDTLKAITKEKKITVDFLDSIAVLSSLSFKRIIIGALMVWIVEISKYLLSNSTLESEKILSKMFGKQGHKIIKVVNGNEFVVNASQINIGDHIAIYTGKQISADGKIVSGNAMLDEKLLTGESIPAEKSIGETVFAMTTILSGKIVIQVESIGENTTAAKITKVIEKSMNYQMHLQSQGEKFANFMVLPTLFLAVFGYVVSGSSAAMAIINADFGTGIRVAAPIALMTYLSLASKNGIIIKNSRVLETIKNIDAIIFDKTGTLTYDVLKINHVFSFSARFSKNDILAYAAAAEEHFDHPIARAIIHEARQKNLTLPVIKHAFSCVGYGIEVETDLGKLKIGSEKFVKKSGIKIIKSTLKVMSGIYKKGNSSILVTMNARIVGLIELVATPRIEAVQVIRDLKSRGIKQLYLISGDHHYATKSIAEKLGFDHYFSGVLPEEKAQYVKKLQEKGYKVAMVGDGVNDAIALSQADFSFSLRGASEVATDIADIIFVDSNLERFNFLFKISEALNNNVKLSLSLIFLPNAFCVISALFGLTGLSTSLVLNNGFNLLAVMNGLIPYFKMIGATQP